MLKVKVIMASNSPKGLGIYIMHFLSAMKTNYCFILGQKDLV